MFTRTGTKEQQHMDLLNRPENTAEQLALEQGEAGFPPPHSPRSSETTFDVYAQG